MIVHDSPWVVYLNWFVGLPQQSIRQNLDYFSDCLVLAIGIGSHTQFGCSVVSCSVMSNSLWTVAFVHGILQAGILAWVAIPFSRVSLQPKD